MTNRLFGRLSGARALAACVALLLTCSSASPLAGAEPAPPAGKPAASESEAARAAVRQFCAAVQTGAMEALLPTVAAGDARAIQERLDRKLQVLKVADLAGLFAGAVPKARHDAARSDREDAPEFNVTLLDDTHARADIEPLLSFRPSVYLLRDDGLWRIDLTRTLRQGRQPRPKEEVLSISRQALQGIADDADLLETEHFLILAHTGPLPAQKTAEQLETLYSDFQKIFPFDLGAKPPAGSGAASAESAVQMPYMPGPDPHMVVFLFSYHQTYLKFAQRHDPDGASSAGYATPPGYFVTWFTAGLKSLVRHEGSHLLMYRRMHLFGAPSWLSEGIAETLADPRDGADSDRRLREMLRGGTPLNLEPLMLKDKIGAGPDYSVSLSLVRFLRVEHPKQWAEFIGFIRRHPHRAPKESRAELLRLLDMTQAQLDEAWTKSVLEARPEVDHP